MIAALHGEWTKLRTLATTSWLLVGTVTLTVAVSAAVAAEIHAGAASRQDPTKLSLTGIYLGQAVISVLAVLVVSDEYATGMINTSLTAVPRRLVLLGAKATNLAGLALLAGILAVAGSLLVGRLLLPTRGLNPAHGYALVSPGDGATLRAAVGTVLYVVIIALLSLGIAIAIRDTAVAIGTVLALLYLPPLLAQAVSDPLRRHLEQVAPSTAGLAIQSTTDLNALPIGPWTGIGVLVAWAGASLLASGLLFRRRDP